MTSDAAWLDDMPALYDDALGPAVFSPWASELSGRASLLAPVALLELAAGTGRTTAALVEAMPTVQITATDLNPAMVSWGARKVPGPVWQAADAQALPFDDSSFDLVICAFGLMFFPDKPAACREVARVLRPGGSMLATIWDVVETSPLTAALVDSLRTVLPDSPPSFIHRVPHGYADEGQIRADLIAGGLVEVVVERMVMTGTAASVPALTEGFCLGTPLRFELQERGDLRQITHAVVEQMVHRLGAGPVEGELGALVVSAVAH